MMTDQWGSLMNCDICNSRFDILDRQPTVLQKCGHTFCHRCIHTMIDVNKSTECPGCGKEINEQSVEECSQNVKLLNFINSDEGLNYINSIPCPKHPDKIVEYFCKTCSRSVCVKCIYDDHNGHSLVQIKEMSDTLKQNVIDLQKMIENSKRIIEENRVLVV
jgi:hypothetical protein